ncbi:cyclic 2,3-diphosphoglycerate synthase [Candidatus Uabimicrobium amorphum]|uniref:GTPase n=1 Tax=Uabimicrobium amorphum TaxID=2596890 RepID=A0A5S9IQ18_UABAM|nr:cyclic 2,3-diphosphoglycerate synthase [Candidatus Uabimicrobium amorphum]BBM85969.1 GTPase [Candidatus Uabimicrobium amorphum]
MSAKRAIIMGAAGRDFHNFNTFFRNNSDYHVVAFTATQIPNIDDKVYPHILAGELYPQGIPILSENDLVDIIAKEKIDVVVFAYSDVSHKEIMHKASMVLAVGADFWLLGAESTMLKSQKPVISVCATRTGCGKSQTARKITQILSAKGKKVAAIRHPMPYGELSKQIVQKFSCLEDLKKHQCTIEEMEEYEPYIAMGSYIYAGIDYEAIVREAEKDADIILWDGGNNDIPFYQPDLEIVVVDPLRPGHEVEYYPGEVNLRRADYVIINKIDSANYEDVVQLRHNIIAVNSQATLIEAASPLTVENYKQINGKRVVVIEDGPTLTHGEMKYGAGVYAAKKYRAKQILDPRPFVEGEMAEIFAKHPHIENSIPAMGYSEKQLRDLETTVNRMDCDLVIIGTPIDLSRVIKIEKPCVRVQYDLQEIGTPNLETILEDFLAKKSV